MGSFHAIVTASSKAFVMVAQCICNLLTIRTAQLLCEGGHARFNTPL